MTVSGVEAWITSAVDDQTVPKAIVLGGSLRLVCTAKKLVVFTTLTVSQEEREKLKEVFDLVLLLEQESPNGLNLEDYAKVQAFSLLLFNKCVYLSPNTLVLKNCDEIFEKYVGFAVRSTEAEVDSNVYLFTPSLDYCRALKKVAGLVEIAGKDACNFPKYFHRWMQNHLKHVDQLDSQYNSYLDIGKNEKNLTETVAIANFGPNHPINLPGIELSRLGLIEKGAVELCQEIYKKITISPPPQGYQNEPIAIVGMSFRLPGGNNVDDFWQLLAKGEEAIKKVPPFRWTRDHSHFQCQDRDVEGGFLDIPLDEFDAKFFGVSPAEAEYLDPQQRLLHEVTWEAFEDAMIDPLKMKGSQTGVFMGSWVHDYKDMCYQTTDIDFFRIYMGNSVASTAGRLSHFLETTGPSIATESACSSAMAALDMACKSLRNGDSSIAIAGGVNLLLHPFHMQTLDFVLAPDSRCKTFDAKADGFGRAEGCVVLLLKRLSDAIRDENSIWGLVRGSALTQEGVSKSLGTPTIQCESLAMELALKDANVHPSEVSYIEAHGTGTSVGDPMEIAAITKAYHTKERASPIIIGSVKTNVGHTESASGLTGIVKVLLSMRAQTIPRHINFTELNPEINLDLLPAQLPLEAMPWPKTSQPRIAGVSSFGISGTDGHAIIQEPPFIPLPEINSMDERPLHIMTVSAKCPESFEKLLLKYQEKFNSSGEEDKFADIAYSANTGRATFSHRAVIISDGIDKAAKIISGKTYKQAEVLSGGRSLCFLFTGQGSQYPKMAQELYKTSPVFRQSFDKCSEILEKYNINLKQVMWGDELKEGELNRTLYSQTSIFVVEYCLLQLWESWGIKPDYVLGHSLGEFAASVAAKALLFEDALMLVAERSLLIDNLPRGKMLVIKADKKAVEQLISSYVEKEPTFWVDYAAINSADQTVLAGDSQAIEDFSKFCEEKDIKSIVLAATHAFHSRHMDPMLEAYRKVAQSIRDLEPCGGPKFISGMDGKVVEREEINANYWVRHTREKVSFMDACKVLQAEGCSLFLEIGPHPVLSALAMMNIDVQSVTCLPSFRRKEPDWTTMLDSLAKLYLSEWKGEIDWKAFDKYYKRKRVEIPFYQFNRKSIWRKLEPISPPIHPLLGRLVRTPTSETIFEMKMTMKNTPFILDHIIGSTVVFPGAGFLEMCLACGHASSQRSSEEMPKPRRPLVLKDLKISAPLALYEQLVCKLHSVAVLEEEDADEIGYSVAIHRFTSKEDWACHATAKFLPIAPKEYLEQTEIIDIKGIKAKGAIVDNKGFYEKLPEVGLRFGPKFQSLEMGWRTDEGILVEVKVPEDNSAYLIHPVVADAMIQAVMLWNSKDKVKKKLQVPVSIGQFVWLMSSDSQKLFIHCRTNGEGKTECVLIDGDGLSLALMKDVELVETSVKLVEGMIHQQGTAMPKLWEETWKSCPGPMQSAYMLQECPFNTEFTLKPEDQFLIDNFNGVGPIEKETYENMCNLSRFYFIQAYYQLGWKPEKGKAFSTDELMAFLPKQEDHLKRFTRFFLRSLADVNILRVESEIQDTFIFDKQPPTKEEIEKGLQHITRPDEATRVDHRLVTQIGRNLKDALTGKVSPLQLLFPNDPSKADAADFYGFMADCLQPLVISVHNGVLDIGINNAYSHFMANASNKMGPPVFRVLEVGAGTGELTKPVIDFIHNLDKPYEYHYTDISAGFFNQAEKKFEKNIKNMVFKKLDMEEDPLAQDFCPGYFDMIYSAEVLHAAKDIRKMLRFLRPLLKPGGLLLVCETMTPDPRITFYFGLLDGYWRFEDTDFRPYHTTLTPQKWHEALSQADFEKITVVTAYNDVHGAVLARAPTKQNNLTTLTLQGKPDKHWLICEAENSGLSRALAERLAGVNRKTTIVKKPEIFSEDGIKELFKKAIDSIEEQLEGILYLWGMSNVNERDQRQISLPFVTLLQAVIGMKTSPKVFVVTQGTNIIDGFEMDNPTPGTLNGVVRATINEHCGLYLASMDLSTKQKAIDQVEEIFKNLWAIETANKLMAFREEKRLCGRMISAKIKNNEPLPLPVGTDRFQLVLPKTRLISDLEFGILEKYPVEDYQVEVQIKAMALNFRDVFAVLKPIEQFEDLNSVGLDFSGVVSKVGKKVEKRKVGERVMGMNMNKNLSLPSHIKMEEQLLVPLPEGMTFEEGVTLPAVFSTAVYCLVNVAKMKRGETLLVHTASGGVGLCAIQLAKRIGCEVIATAGSQRKRNYLNSLGIKYVFNSRSIDFGEQVLEVTNRRGVDIVLNSLTGEGFKEASLKALGRNGKFIEMSKLNVWKEEEVKALRPDVFYRIVDLTSLDKAEYEELTEELKEFLHSEFIQPIPYDRFDALNIRGALNYLQKAKHIGKIVCVMPEIRIENSRIVTNTKLFNEESTYLVTGGLGGIGFEVVRWMLSNGAKYIAIASRSEPKAGLLTQMDTWNRGGKRVKAFAVDIGDYEECKGLFEEIGRDSNFPKLRGIMHAAGVLRDMNLEEMNWDSFEHTFNPKVRGTWNLHDLSKGMLLEHFVLFSSAVAILGTPMQANHCASNSFEDAFASYRRSCGLPATTVNWGNWGEVGVATDIDIPGVRPIPTSQGILTLEMVLKTQTSHISVLNIEQFPMVIKIFHFLKYYLDDKRLLGEIKTSTLINSDEFWTEMDATEDREGKVDVFKKFIKSVLRNILKLDPDEPIDDLTDFQSLGVDSLMMLEMKNGMQNLCGTRMTLTPTQFKDCNNTEVLANRMADILLEGDDSEKNLPNREELRLLIREDSILPDGIQLRGAKAQEEIRRVLLTGASGTLGPYILRELTGMKGIEKVYCLLRKGGKDVREKLIERLQDVNLLDEVDLNKVECVEGDITANNLGLKDEMYYNLSEEIDAIFHCAVRSDHKGKYWKAPETKKEHVRTVNVLGTVRILEFAVENRLKSVYYASTLLTLSGEGENGEYSEEWQDIKAFDEAPLSGGYPISKFISENLVREAIKRGVPVKVFRLPHIAGDKKTGRCDYKANHIVLRWLTFMKMGLMYDFPAPISVMAVDDVVRLSLSVFFNKEAKPDVYNVVQKFTEVDQMLISVAEKFGIYIKTVEYSEFVRNLKQDTSLMAPFKDLYDEEEETVMKGIEAKLVPFIQKYMKDSSNCPDNQKMYQFAKEYDEFNETYEDVVFRDLKYLEKEGVFDKAGIKYDKKLLK